MDAASPVWWRLFAAGLLAFAGCKSDDAAGGLSARGQAPVELPAPLAPAPLAPAPAPAPSPSAPPSAPAAPPQPLPPMAAVPLPSAPVATAPPASTGSTTSSTIVQGYPVRDAAVPVAVAPSAGAPVQGYPVPTGPIAQASMVAPGPPAGPPPPRLAPHPAPPRGGSPQVRVAAIVGSGNLITEQEVIEAYRQHFPDFAALPTAERSRKEKELYQEELRNLIERELLIDDMFTRLKKNKQPIDDIKEDVAKMADEWLRSMRKERGIRTEAELVEMLSRTGQTLPIFRRQIERQIMSQQFVSMVMKETGKNRTPGFAEVRAYYLEHLQDFTVEDRVRWQDLFISYNKYPRREDARARADYLLQQARAGAEFVALIKLEEGNPRGRQNWDGIGTRRNDVPVDLAPVVFEVKPGGLSGIVETPAGLHIVKVLEREYAGTRPLDEKVQQECSAKIKRQWAEREYKRIVENLWRTGTVQVFEMEPGDASGTDGGRGR